MYQPTGVQTSVQDTTKRSKRSAKKKGKHVNCGICKVNSNDKRHFGSPEHREKIKYILDKESVKINIVKEALENKQPLVDTRTLEEQSNFQAFCWCRLCDVEAKVSVPLHSKSVVFGDEQYTQHEVISSNKYLAYGFHLSSKNHKKSLKTFWSTYKLNSSDMFAYFFTKRQKKELEDNLLILVGLIEKDTVSLRSLSSESLQPLPKAPPADVSVPTPTPTIKRIQSTVVASIGLTCIEVPELDEGENNVFSGGVPPWLRKTTTTNIIGPSLPPSDYVPSSKQKVINPNKIGGLFDRAKAKRAGEDFLPSFSGVWHDANKSRYQSKKEFQQQHKKQKVEKPS